MKILTALSLSIFSILLAFFITLQVYQVPFIQNARIDTWRQGVDSLLKRTYSTQRTRWVNDVIFRNKDKYTWYPPRIQLVYNENSIIRYKVYGMVTSWDSNTRLLTVSSYLGKPLYIRFSPTPAGPIAIIPKLDRYGQLTSLGVQTIEYFNVPNWNTLFCQHDIVAVNAKSYMQFFQSTREKPLVPTVITLTLRICDQ
jgi:hypothetical protein